MGFELPSSFSVERRAVSSIDSPSLSVAVIELAQGGEVERLGDEVERAELERADGGLDVAVRRDHGHRDPGAVRLDPLDELEPVAVGQPHVGQHEVVAFATEAFHGGREVPRGDDVDLHAAERDREQFADVRLVVDDQGRNAWAVVN